MEHFGCLLFSIVIGMLAELTNSISLKSLNNSEQESSVSVKLLYGDSAGISWSDLSVTERLAPLLTDKKMDVTALDYHYKQGLVFFSARGHIFRANITAERSSAELTFTDHRVVVKAAGATTLAVDWLHDHLYWAANHSLHRVNLDGSGRRPLLERPLHSNILSIVLDPHARLLFVAEAEDIWTYDLRSSLVRCLPFQRMRVVSLALSVRMRRLYASTRSDGAPRVFSCEYDGSTMTEYRIDQEWWRQLIAIGVFRDQLFWVHRGWFERDTVWKANVSTNSSLSWEMEFVARGSGSDEAPEININSLAVYHPEAQTDIEYNKEDVFLENANVEEAITEITFSRVEGTCRNKNSVSYSDGSKASPYNTCLLFIFLCIIIH